MSNLILLLGLQHDIKTYFENFKHRLSCNYIMKTENWMFGIKLMPLKIRSILFISLYDVDKSALLMKHTYNAMIRKKQ